MLRIFFSGCGYLTESSGRLFFFGLVAGASPLDEDFRVRVRGFRRA